MATWPVDLPQKPVTTGYSQKMRDNTLRFKPDIGPSKVRPRQESGREDVTMVFHMNNTELADFETFVEETIQDGVIEIDLNDPITDTASEYLLLKPPTITVIGQQYFAVRMEMRKL